MKSHLQTRYRTDFHWLLQVDMVPQAGLYT